MNPAWRSFFWISTVATTLIVSISKSIKLILNHVVSSWLSSWQGHCYIVKISKLQQHKIKNLFWKCYSVVKIKYSNFSHFNHQFWAFLISLLGSSISSVCQNTFVKQFSKKWHKVNKMGLKEDDYLWGFSGFKQQVEGISVATSHLHCKICEVNHVKKKLK